VGEAAAAEGVDFLLTVGDDDSRLIHDAFGDPARSRRCGTAAEAAAWLRAEATGADLVLLKGSRSAAMENVLSILEAGSRSGPAVNTPDL